MGFAKLNLILPIDYSWKCLLGKVIVGIFFIDVKHAISQLY